MENIAYILNMFVHILMVIVYAGGLIYYLVLTRKREKLGPGYLIHLDPYMEQFFIKQPLLWMGYLVVIILTGFNFALISFSFHGKPPDIAPLAFGALVTMVILTFISLGLVNLLWKKRTPFLREVYQEYYPSTEEVEKLQDLRQDRIASTQMLLILALIIIFCAVTLRFMA